MVNCLYRFDKCRFIRPSKRFTAIDVSNLLETYTITQANNTITPNHDGYLAIYATVANNTAINLNNFYIAYEGGSASSGSSIIIPVRKGVTYTVTSDSWSNILMISCKLYGIM